MLSKKLEKKLVFGNFVIIQFLIFHTECTKQCKILRVAPEKHNNKPLAHLSCTLNVALGTGTRQCVVGTGRGLVRVPTHGYGYGYETMCAGTGTGLTCQ